MPHNLKRELAGIALIARAGVLEASTTPCRSTILPREAGTSNDTS